MTGQNIELYESLLYLKDFYLSTTYYGLCDCVQHLPNCNFIIREKLQNELDKLAVKKGIYKSHDYWWPTSDFASRIKFLNELIDEYTE